MYIYIYIMPERTIVKECTDVHHYYLTYDNGYIVCVFCDKRMIEVKRDENKNYYYDTYSNVEKNERVVPETQRVIVTNCTAGVNNTDRGTSGESYRHYYTLLAEGLTDVKNRRCVFCGKLQAQAEMKQVNEFKNTASGESYYYYDNSTTEQHGQKTEQHEQKYMKYKNKYLNLKKLSQL